MSSLRGSNAKERRCAATLSAFHSSILSSSHSAMSEENFAKSTARRSGICVRKAEPITMTFGLKKMKKQAEKSNMDMIDSSLRLAGRQAFVNLHFLSVDLSTRRESSHTRRDRRIKCHLGCWCFFFLAKIPRPPYTYRVLANTSRVFVLEIQHN